MTIILEQEYNKDLGINYEEIADKVINYALDYEKCPYETEISLTLTDNKGIWEVNKEFRQMDKPTDVLSFPLIEYAVPGEFDFLEDMDDCFNPETGELMLGDILISLDKVYEQANEYGHSVTREYAFLIAHSMLHLMGYDHMEEEEAKIMESKQKEILSDLGILR